MTTPAPLQATGFQLLVLAAMEPAAFKLTPHVPAIFLPWVLRRVLVGVGMGLGVVVGVGVGVGLRGMVGRGMGYECGIGVGGEDFGFRGSSVCLG